MTQPNFNNSSGDYDWEDKGDVLWNEQDWQQYLRATDVEVARFLKAYLKHRNEPNHMDEVARRLGWDRVDWALPPMEDSNEDTEDPILSGLDEASAEDVPAELLANIPYTAHRHPVFMATRGLCLHLERVWHYFFSHNTQALPAAWAWGLFSAIHMAERNAIMAIHAVDMGDFSLAVCHLKNGLSAINNCLRFLQMLPEPVAAMIERLIKDTRTTLFDMRDIWLRVIRDCREEARYDAEGDASSED